MRLHADRGVDRWVVAAAIVGTILLGVGAFWLSFTALADLAERAGTPPGIAWLWPLIVDGVIVIATMSVVALSRHGVKATRYPWLLLTGAALVSVSANITHALVAADDDVPGLLAALVASVPPLVLLAATHLTVELGRHQNSPLPRLSATITALDRAENTPSTPPPPRLRTLTAGDDTTSRDEPAVEPDEQLTGTDARREQLAAGASGGHRDQAARLHDEGWSNRQIATRLGVHPSTVGRWLKASSTAAEADNTDVPREDQQR